LLVKNFAECFHFYRDVLGLASRFGDSDGVYAEFDAGGFTLALFGRGAMADAVGAANLPVQCTAQDRVCLIFEVKDVEKAWVKLREAGVEAAAEPTDHPEWGVRTAHLRDPDGNLIEINQPIPFNTAES
jgi:lactoylglutathione lyase